MILHSRACSFKVRASLNSESRRPVPQSIHDVDRSDVLHFRSCLPPNHPGFEDKKYVARRQNLAHIALNHVIGTPISFVKYTEDENKLWRKTMRRLRPLHEQVACKQYNHAMRILQYPDIIPQLDEVSDALEHYNGWRILPVAGLLHPRQFLNSLAFKYFNSTQHVRHHLTPHYTHEPDVIHELIGHIPLLLDTEFSSMVQAIGEASLYVEDKHLCHLVNIYWYIVEFGMIKQGHDLKVIGAGILTSSGEIDHVIRNNDIIYKALDLYSPLPTISYDNGYQKLYYVLEDLTFTSNTIRKYALDCVQKVM
jgi:phenylalanine-4-hydroxylase